MYTSITIRIWNIIPNKQTCSCQREDREEGTNVSRRHELGERWKREKWKACHIIGSDGVIVMFEPNPELKLKFHPSVAQVVANWRCIEHKIYPLETILTPGSTLTQN